PLKDGDLLAAIDLGSNSFHMVVARYLLGQLHVVDRLREAVRIADGLDAKGGLSSKACERALECLARFGQRLRNMPSPHVRALATNTVRRLRSPQAFLVLAETALGHSIEVVSGREEARLIYLGVAHAQPPRLDQHRLVIDIGGGSTEFIIGKGFEPLERESLQVGCIASTRRFFPEGKISKKRWNDALTEIGTEFQQFAAQYNALGWQEALGSSGTHKTIAKICTEMKLAKGEITAEALPVLREELLKAKRIEDIHLPGLSAHRRPIIAGGILVLEAVFQTLGLEKLLVSKAAMREGILYDMLGRAGDNDPRDTSVAVLMHRYAIDEQQALRVETTAQLLFQQACGPWALDADDARVLCWAARLHE
ncbi:MAG TPA: exopolyphosphatase, partial [Xylella fastidiosa subsp. multiplex]